MRVKPAIIIALGSLVCFVGLPVLAAPAPVLSPRAPEGFSVTTPPSLAAIARWRTAGAPTSVVRAERALTAAEGAELARRFGAGGGVPYCGADGTLLRVPGTLREPERAVRIGPAGEERVSFGNPRAVWIIPREGVRLLLVDHTCGPFTHPSSLWDTRVAGPPKRLLTTRAPLAIIEPDGAGVVLTYAEVTDEPGAWDLVLRRAVWTAKSGVTPLDAVDARVIFAAGEVPMIDAAPTPGEVNATLAPSEVRPRLASGARVWVLGARGDTTFVLVPTTATGLDSDYDGRHFQLALVPTRAIVQ